MIYLYESTITDFIYNGQPFPKAYEVTVDRTINDEFFITGKHPLDENNRYKLIQKDKIIKAHTPDGMQPFRIMDVNKRLGYVEFEAWPLLYADLRNKLVKPFKLSNSSGQSVLNTFINNLLLGTKFSFTSNILSTHDFSVRDETEAQEDPNQLYDALEVFKRIVNRWSGELIINGYDIRLVSRLGKDTDALLYEKKNITDFVDKESVQGIVTRVHGKSEWTEDGPDGKQLTKRIKTTVDSPLINAYSGIVFEQQFTNNDTRTEQELKNWLTLKFSTENIDKPSRTIELDTNIVDETEVALGDKLNLKYLKHDVDMLIRMTKYQYDGFNNRYIKIFVGDALEHFTGSVQNTISVVETNIKNSVDKTIAHVIVNQLGQKIIYSEYEPEGDYREGDVWFDNKGGMFIWNEESANWIPHPFNNRMDAIGQEVNAAIEQADADRTKAEQKINQALTDAKHYTEVKAQEIDSQLLIVNQNVLTASNSANAAVLKADKAIEDVGFMKLDVAQIKSDTATALGTANTAKTNSQAAMTNALTAISKAETAISTTGNLSLVVDDLERSVTFKADSSRVDTISGKVDNQAIQIKANADGLSFKADKSLVDTVKGTVDQNTLDIAATNKGLTFKADSSRVDTIKGTVDSHTAELGIQAQAITARLTSAQVDSLVTGKGYVNQAQLTATSNAWNLQLTQVSTNLNNLEIGGTNLIYNSEIPPFSPINYSGGTYVVSKALESVPFLNVSMVTEVSRTNGGGDFRPPDITIDDGRSREYTVSVWVRPVSSSVTLTLTLGVNDKEMTGTTIVLTDTTKWVRVTYSKKFSANVDGTLLRVYLNLGENQKARFSKIKLEKGIKATDWSPAPNDMATLEKFTTLEATVDGIQTTVGTKANQSQVTQLATQVSTKVESAAYNSKMTQLDSSINLRLESSKVISQINLSTEGILLQGKRIQLDGDITMTTAFVTDIKAYSLDAVYADIATLKTKVLTADVVTSTMLKSDTALITKLFATDANVNVLTAKTAFVTAVKAQTISADKITAGTLNAANVNIINLNVNNLVGNTTDFIKSNWNALNSTLSIDGTALHINNTGQNDKAMLQKGGMTFYFSGTEVGRVGLNYSQQSTESYLSFSARNGQGMNWAVETGVNTGVYDTIMEVPKGQKTLRMQKTLNLNGNSITEVASIYSPQHIISNGLTTSEVGKLYASGSIAVLNANTQLNIQVGGASKASVTSASFNLHADLNANGNTLLNMDSVYYGTNMEIRKVNGNTLDVRSNTQLRLVVNGFTMLDVLRSSSTNTGLNMHANLNMMGNVVTGQSDRRLKKHIFNTSGDSLSAINRWIFVDYEWIDANRPNGIKFGLIAQDTPELAIFDSLNDIYNIDYSKLSLMNSHAIQQMNQRVTSIENVTNVSNTLASRAFSEMQQLKSKVTELELKIKQLESAA